MAQFHRLDLTIEEMTQDGFDDESMRVLAQDVANYATQRAQELNLDCLPACVIYARDDDYNSDNYKYLASFDGVKK